MKLEHLAPYLPYGLKCRTKIGDLFLNRLTNCETFKAWFVYTYDSKNALVKHNYEVNTSNDNTCGKGFRLNEIKPILRPLSEFKYQDIIKVNNYLGLGKWCDYYDLFFDAWFDDSERLQNLVLQMPFELMQFFLKNHFDVFGLIEKGEAIDINTL